MKKLLILISYSLVLLCLNAQTKQKIACVGNSITYGYGLSSAATQSYPAQLQTLLGTTDWQVGNYGVNSRTMLKKGDKPYWSESAYANAKAFLPNVVMIELGTNDAKTTNWNPYGKEFVSNYKEMINVFRNLSSKPEVYVGLIPPGENVGWTILFNYVKDSVNTRIKQVAIESGVNLIDMFDALNGNTTNWFNSTLFQSDGIHPKTAGAAIIAQKVKEMISMPKPQLMYANGKVSAPLSSDYQWYVDGFAVSEAEGGKNQELVPTKLGLYKVSLKLYSTNETRIVSAELKINELTSFLKNTKTKDFKIYPNPTFDGRVNIESSLNTRSQISIYDFKGCFLSSLSVNDNTSEINLEALPSGNYILRFESSDFVHNSKLIKVN